MNGERLKLKRQADRLSLQDFVELLSKYGVSVTKGALSNYENGRAVPDKEMLTAMRQALGVSDTFLERECLPIDIRHFLCHDRPPRRQLELDSYVAVNLEKRIEIDRIIGQSCRWQPPSQLEISTEADLLNISLFVEQVRGSWGLSDYPIPSVTNLLERWDWDIYELPAAFGVSGVVGYDKISGVPFLYYPVRAGVVNVRMQLLTLAASAYLAVKEESLEAEAVRRFATAILLSEEQAVREFGKSRSAIGAEELNLVKNRYGLPKYEIMGRLLDLNIIDAQLYNNYMSKIRQQGYPSSRDSMAEPLFFYENSVMYKMKVQYALAENLLPDHGIGRDLMTPRIHRR